MCLEVARARSCRKVGNAGVDCQDSMCTVLGVRFADDMLFIAKTAEGTQFLFDEVVGCLVQAGLQLNVGKTTPLTAQSQSPSKVPLRNGHEIEVRTVLLLINGWDRACCAQQILAITSDLAHHLHVAL